MVTFDFDPDSIWDAVRRLADDNDNSWRFSKKGDKRPLCDIDAAVQGRKRVRETRRLVTTERILAAARARNLDRAIPGQDIASRMCVRCSRVSFTAREILRA
jgi:hypothetical protein